MCPATGAELCPCGSRRPLRAGRRSQRELRGRRDPVLSREHGAPRPPLPVIRDTECFLVKGNIFSSKEENQVTHEPPRTGLSLRHNFLMHLKRKPGVNSLLFLASAVLCVISLPGLGSRSRCPLLAQAGAARKSAGPGFAHTSFTQVLHASAFSSHCYVVVCVLWGLRHRTLRSKSPQSAWLLGNA